MIAKCRECDKDFHTQSGQGQLFCSVHCQLKRDPLESEPVHRPSRRARPAKTVKIPRSNIPVC